MLHRRDGFILAPVPPWLARCRTRPRPAGIPARFGTGAHLHGAHLHIAVSRRSSGSGLIPVS
ncbi:hypothetical protein CCP3SC1_1910002 [Gammaproteobacteria bacterium]